MREGYKMTELGEIPFAWGVKELNQVTDYVDYRGKTPPKVAEGIFLVTAKNIKNGKIDYTNSKEYVPVESYKSIMSRGLPKIGDVLITTEAPLGEIASIDKENIALAQRIIKYRGHNNVLRNDYLKYSLLSPYFQEGLDKDSTGSTVKGIKGSRLHKQKILIPPIPEQQKIATILSTVDEKIEVIEEQIKETETLKKGLMQQLLTKGIGHTKFKDSPLGEIPESWEVVNLNNLVNPKRPIRYGIVQTGENVPDGIPCLRVADFSKVRFDKSLMIKTSKEISDSYKQTVLIENDIVFPLRGCIGNVRVIKQQDAGINLTRGVALISYSKKINPSYLSWQIISQKVGREILLQVNGTTLKEVPISGLKKILIPVASPAEQLKISEVLDAVDEKLEVLQARKENFQELKKGLMQQLLTGKMRVNLN